VPFSAALFVQGLLSLAAAIPAAPGFFGLFEAAAKEGLRVYGVSSTLAVSWALGYHMLTFVPITVFGAVYFARLGIRMADVQRASGAAR
jgi:glycosyltransferase 2 family protein